MYAMRLLQWGLGMARYFRGLAQPAIDVMGEWPYAPCTCSSSTSLLATMQPQDNARVFTHVNSRTN